MAEKDLLRELRSFVIEHPQGWTHDEWLGFLFHLSQQGISTDDENGIGAALERERLAHTLGNLTIKGLGPKRREALATRFGALYRLMEASPEEIAEVPGVPRALADQISEVLR